MNYLYAALGGILLLTAIFFYGMHVGKTADVAKAATHELKQDQKLNAKTATQTLAAATHIQAVQANGSSLKQDIARQFTPAPSGGTHATLAPAADTDPLDSPAFRLCYDAASAGKRTCQAGNVLPQPAANPQSPAD